MAEHWVTHHGSRCRLRGNRALQSGRLCRAHGRGVAGGLGVGLLRDGLADDAALDRLLRHLSCTEPEGCGAGHAHKVRGIAFASRQAGHGLRAGHGFDICAVELTDGAFAKRHEVPAAAARIARTLARTGLRRGRGVGHVRAARTVGPDLRGGSGREGEAGEGGDRETHNGLRVEPVMVNSRLRSG